MVKMMTANGWRDFEFDSDDDLITSDGERSALKDQPHALYRFFNGSNELLYIGITNNPGRRFGQHSDRKPWWSEVATIRLEPYPSRAAVLEAERLAIAAERPIHNIQHRRSEGRPAHRRDSVSSDSTKSRCRDDIALAGPADPSSLVGSFFHTQGGRFAGHYQGLVVAEPAPAVYLVQFYSFMTGGPTDQQLVPITEMTDWLFYDDHEWMQDRYEHGLRQRWEREREAAELARIEQREQQEEMRKTLSDLFPKPPVVVQ